jgi:hypothetical protein
LLDLHGRSLFEAHVAARSTCCSPVIDVTWILLNMKYAINPKIGEPIIANLPSTALPSPAKTLACAMLGLGDTPGGRSIFPPNPYGSTGFCLLPLLRLA